MPRLRHGDAASADRRVVMTHKAAIIKSLLDQAFRVLQHDSGEDQPEYAHLREALGKSFWKVLKDVRLARPAQTERALTPAQLTDVYCFARAADLGEFIERAQAVFDAAQAQSEPTLRTHTTQPGESVAGIALRQCGSEEKWQDILVCNPKFADLRAPDYFPVGTVLTLPAAQAKTEPKPAINLRKFADKVRNGIADYVADNMADRKHSLAEIDAYIRAIEINADRLATQAERALMVSRDEARYRWWRNWVFRAGMDGLLPCTYLADVEDPSDIDFAIDAAILASLTAARTSSGGAT